MALPVLKTLVVLLLPRKCIRGWPCELTYYWATFAQVRQVSRDTRIPLPRFKGREAPHFDRHQHAYEAYLYLCFGSLVRNLLAFAQWEDHGVGRGVWGNISTSAGDDYKTIAIQT